MFRLLLGDSSDTRKAESSEQFRIVASDGSYDETLRVGEHAVRLSPRKLMLEFHDAPLDVLCSVFYGFGPEPSLEWISAALLSEANASRHGADSMETPPDAPPDAEDWAEWEHPDRVGTLLAKYENREPLEDW